MDIVVATPTAAFHPISDLIDKPSWDAFYGSWNSASTGFDPMEVSCFVWAGSWDKLVYEPWYPSERAGFSTGPGAANILDA